MKTYNTLSEAYLGSLEDVLDNPEYVCAPRGIPIREITNYSFKVMFPDSNPVVTKDLDRNVTIASYTAKEKALYDSGSNRVEDFAKASKFWEKLANPDSETVNSAYGFLIFKNHSYGNAEFECGPRGTDAINYNKTTFEERIKAYRTPWEWCLESLKADKDTRQAILHFNLPKHAWMGVKDFPCTLSGTFQIRENKLNFSIVMRSNDLVKGSAFDFPWFASLIEKMVEELKPTYPELQVGSYVHAAQSLHIYDRDVEVVKKMLGRI